jgi:hypothetical protein
MMRRMLMKKSDLQQGMCVQTTHNRYGVVELDRNRIDFCYDPDVLKDEYAHLEKVSLDDVFEYGNEQLGIGCIVTKELQEKYPDFYGEYEVGITLIFYEIVAAYVFEKVYDNGEGTYPPLKLK